MLENLNHYLQFVYTSHKYAYAVMVLLSITVIGSGMEALAQLLTVKSK